MHRRNLGVSALVLAVAATGLTAGVASAASDPATPPTYVRTNIDTGLAGAAFTVSGDVTGDTRPELVTSSFGTFSFGPFGPIPPAAGTVTLFGNAAKNKQGGDIDYSIKTEIVKLSDGVALPNKPTLADVDGDGDTDVIVPGGWFFGALSGSTSGSLSWWEQRANGTSWVRHNLISNVVAAYHSAQVADLDGDGIADLTTVAENAGNPSSAADDIIKVEFLKGLGGGNFAAPVAIGNGGGSTPVIYDVNNDGLLDIVSAQYFGGVLGQPFIPSFARQPDQASFVWFEQGGDRSGGLSAANFTKRTISANEGPSFEIRPVANFRGDGVTRWIGTNHTNKNVAVPNYPAPAVYEFTPTGDPRQPWTKVQLTTEGAFQVTGGAGQASPGGTTAGDLDGDGDLDLAVSGDGDRRVYWVEQKADGTFPLHQLPNSDGYGQAGGQLAVDLNRDNINEIVFSSFDQNTLAFWKR